LTDNKTLIINFPFSIDILASVGKGKQEKRTREETQPRER
jgi:hypothetical protein